MKAFVGCSFQILNLLACLQILRGVGEAIAARDCPKVSPSQRLPFSEPSSLRLARSNVWSSTTLFKSSAAQGVSFPINSLESVPKPRSYRVRRSFQHVMKSQVVRDSALRERVEMVHGKGWLWVARGKQTSRCLVESESHRGLCICTERITFGGDASQSCVAKLKITLGLYRCFC